MLHHRRKLFPFCRNVEFYIRFNYAPYKVSNLTHWNRISHRFSTARNDEVERFLIPVTGSPHLPDAIFSIVYLFKIPFRSNFVTIISSICLRTWNSRLYTDSRQSNVYIVTRLQKSKCRVGLKLKWHNWKSAGCVSGSRKQFCVFGGANSISISYPSGRTRKNGRHIHRYTRTIILLRLNSPCNGMHLAGEAAIVVVGFCTFLRYFCKLNGRMRTRAHMILGRAHSLVAGAYVSIVYACHRHSAGKLEIILSILFSL